MEMFLYCEEEILEGWLIEFLRGHDGAILMALLARSCAHIVSNSFGGYLVSLVARLWPALVKSLVLCNTVGSVPFMWQRPCAPIAYPRICHNRGALASLCIPVLDPSADPSSSANHSDLHKPNTKTPQPTYK
eukprot:Gb_01974 [translate_table: standard]